MQLPHLNYLGDNDAVTSLILNYLGDNDAVPHLNYIGNNVSSDPSLEQSHLKHKYAPTAY